MPESFPPEIFPKDEQPVLIYEINRALGLDLLDDSISNEHPQIRRVIEERSLARIVKKLGIRAPVTNAERLPECLKQFRFAHTRSQRPNAFD
jgi:hypothetical protein